MSESNWSFLTGGLAAASVSRGVTSAFVKPNGGGTFTFGFSSRDSSDGVVGLHLNTATFAPLVNDAGDPSGGSVRAAIKRGVSGGPTEFAPFLFIGLAGVSTSDQGYLLGLSDDDPNQIILRKGAPSGGLRPDAAGILRTSSETFLPDVWHHLRLDMIVNPNGDVVLNAFRSDLGTNPVTAPVWAAITGMDSYTDDALGVSSGSLPLTGGYVGFGFQTSEISRRGYLDHVECYRQRP